MVHSSRHRPNVWTLAAAYLAVTVVVSWPLAARLTTSLGGDYGDSVFVTWVMTWVGRHLTALLQGDIGAWQAMWQAPIFAPESDTLTYSEHFIAQAVQALPISWATGNPLLAYNVVLVSAFVLTGLAAHLLAYRLTGSQVAGAVSGLTLAFSHYRLYWSLAHLHTLSVHWWIFALLGFDVFAATGSIAALTAATGALLVLNLSSNYLMAFCALFTPVFCLWALARHGRLRDQRRWAGLAVSGAFSLLCVWPVVRRYLATRAALDFSRTLPEIVGNSATLAGYWQEMSWLGPLLGLAVVGAVVAPSTGERGLSLGARLGLAGLAVIALVLSLGPQVGLGDLTLPGPYGLLFSYVPGFAGLRVAHRFAVIGLVFVSLLAGIGAARLARHRAGLMAAVVLTLLATRSAWTGPFSIDVPIDAPRLAPVPEYLRPSMDVPRVYRFARTLPADAVLLELLFGDLAYEIRFTYFTMTYGQRTVNGYSGVLPRSYLTRAAVLQAPLADAEASWTALAPATHVIVHTAAWLDDTGTRVRDWLEDRGARAMAEEDGAWLYELPLR